MANPAGLSRSRLSSFEAGICRRRLPTGLTLISVPRPGNDHFYLSMLIRAGARLETPESFGVAHFLEHMMFRGSATHPGFAQLAEAFERLGGEWNAATGHEHTEYWYSGISHVAEPALALFADFLENPKFEDIEVERNVIERELDGETNDHGHSTDMDYHVACLMWPGSTMAHPILGTKATIGKMTVAKLNAFRDKHYAPANMALCVIGGESGEGMLDRVEKLFAGHRSAYAAKAREKFPVVPAFVGPKWKWIEHSDNEYEIRLSFLVGGEWSPEAQELELLSRLLADGFCARLVRRLREELGLVYDIAAWTALSTEMGTLEISASCATDQLEHFLKELFAALRRLADEGPTTGEMERISTRALVDLELFASHPDGIVQKLSWAAVSGKTVRLADDRAHILAATPDSLKALARATFRKDKAALAVLGPKSANIEARLEKALASGLP